MIFNQINEMGNSQEYLILDAAKGIGYAFIQNLIKKNIAFTLLEGRIENTELINEACEGKRFLFMSYDGLHDMDNPVRQETLEEVIRICTRKNIRIIYCAGVFDAWLYSKSLIRLTIEEMLLDATVNHGARVTTVRISNCWGPNMSDRVLQQIFQDAINGRKLWYPLNSDLPCQFVYAEDAAEVIYRLTQLNNTHPWQVYNYGGTTYTTAKSFLHRISEIAGSPKEVGTIREWQILVRSLVSDRMKELQNRVQHYRESYLLDNAVTNSLLADFRPSPIDKAIEDTLAWYKNNI
jgi:hypothetical protein